MAVMQSSSSERSSVGQSQPAAKGAPQPVIERLGEADAVARLRHLRAAGKRVAGAVHLLGQGVRLGQLRLARQERAHRGHVRGGLAREMSRSVSSGIEGFAAGGAGGFGAGAGDGAAGAAVRPAAVAVAVAAWLDPSPSSSVPSAAARPVPAWRPAASACAREEMPTTSALTASPLSSCDPAAAARPPRRAASRGSPVSG